MYTPKRQTNTRSLINQQYDQLIKYASALLYGTAEAESILKRFTRANVKHPTYFLARGSSFSWRRFSLDICILLSGITRLHTRVASTVSPTCAPATSSRYTAETSQGCSRSRRASGSTSGSVK